jgi:hypothetical protein
MLSMLATLRNSCEPLKVTDVFLTLFALTSVWRNVNSVSLVQGVQLKTEVRPTASLTALHFRTLYIYFFQCSSLRFFEESGTQGNGILNFLRHFTCDFFLLYVCTIKLHCRKLNCVLTNKRMYVTMCFTVFTLHPTCFEPSSSGLTDFCFLFELIYSYSCDMRCLAITLYRICSVSVQVAVYQHVLLYISRVLVCNSCNYGAIVLYTGQLCCDIRPFIPYLTLFVHK